MGAEGVFIAGCGEQCARENTAYWVNQRVGKVRKALMQIGLQPERVRAFTSGAADLDVSKELDTFIEQIGGLYLTSTIMQEVKS
jgi:coenzyme F420-reducing hydrogenase delta subunit